MEETLFTMIRDIGFPIVVTFYLLHRMETKLDEVIIAISNIDVFVKHNQHHSHQEDILSSPTIIKDLK